MAELARVLIVAGSDSGGGAGIQADIKTVTMLGAYAMTAITALTAQNTQGVFGIHEVPPEFIAQQMRLVLEDIGADCIKTGMLHNTEVIAAVAEVLAEYPAIPLVLDPVMVAKGGSPLLQDAAVEALREKLLPRATLITPNIPEAEILTGLTIRSNEDMEDAGQKLLEFGAKAALIKGGHMPGDTITDILISPTGLERFSSPRINTRHTHGTGCTLASAIATGLAKKQPLAQAVKQARQYVLEALRHAPGLGTGHGPLGHNYLLAKNPSKESAA